MLLVDVLGVILTVVTIHESGHYLIGRLYGYPMPVFSIGIGPRAAHLFTHAGTQFILSWFPIGGFVTIEDGDDDDDACIDDSLSLRQRLWRNVAVYAAGSLANIMSVIVVAIVYYWWFRDGLLGSGWLVFVDEKVDLFIFGSLFLALVNWLPIPPLDGSRIAFALIEIARNRQINADFKNVAFLIGSIFLSIYMIIDWSWFFYFLIWG